MGAARRGCHTLILELHVQPGAKQSEFAGMHGKRIKVRIAAPAVDDKANTALVDFLAGYFGIPKRNVSILSGVKSRSKRVSIEGVDRWKMPSS